MWSKKSQAFGGLEKPENVGYLLGDSNRELTRDEERKHKNTENAAKTVHVREIHEGEPF